MTSIKAALDATAHASCMDPHLRHRFTSASLVATLALACSRTSPHEDPTRDLGTAEVRTALASGCSDETRERDGTLFVRLCATADLWIATTPLVCSPGDHATVRCPIATPLVFAPRLRATPRAVAVVEREIAHRVCGYAFGGRLPTRDERHRARTSRGMATLLASDTTHDGTFLAEVPEWTEDGPCSDPARLSPACSGDKHPTWFRRGDAVAWESLRACELGDEATPIGPPVRLGEHCDRDSCFLVGPMIGRAVPRALRCTPRAVAVHPTGTADVAAIRCVVHERILAAR